MCVIAAAAHRHIYSLSAFFPPLSVYLSLFLSFGFSPLLLLLCDFGRNYCEIAHHVARLSPALIGGSFFSYTFPACAHIGISVCVCAQCACVWMISFSSSRNRNNTKQMSCTFVDFWCARRVPVCVCEYKCA